MYVRLSVCRFGCRAALCTLHVQATFTLAACTHRQKARGPLRLDPARLLAARRLDSVSPGPPEGQSAPGPGATQSGPHKGDIGHKAGLMPYITRLLRRILYGCFVQSLILHGIGKAIRSISPWDVEASILQQARSCTIARW